MSFRKLSITITTLLFATVSLTSVTAQPAGAATSNEQAIARDVATFINAERAHRGLSQISWTFDEGIRSQMAAKCGDPMNGMSGDYFAVATCGTPGTAGKAVNSLMASTGHNRILTKLNATSIRIGAFCESSGRLRVGAWVDVPLKPPYDDPSASFSGPITSTGAGTACTAAPPPTQPPPPPPPSTTPATTPPTVPATVAPSVPTDTKPSQVTAPPSHKPTAPPPSKPSKPVPPVTVPKPTAPVASTQHTPSGSTVVTYADGTKTTTAEDGTVTTVTPDGEKYVESTDGTTTRISPDGERVVTDENGETTVVHSAADLLSGGASALAEGLPDSTIAKAEHADSPWGWLVLVVLITAGGSTLVWFGFFCCRELAKKATPSRPEGI